jgi:DNA modification methylase
MGSIIIADAIDGLRQVESGTVDMCVTSPPYYQLRNYNVDGQIGLEETPELYITRLVEVFREVKRVLRDDGTLWVNIGDSYAGSGKNAGNSKPHLKATKGLEHLGDTLLPRKLAGHKAKDLIGIPWMLAFALRADGWYLRQDIIWAKPNPMPESVTDRCTKSHEYIFLLSKNSKYYYDNDAIKEKANDKYAGRYNSPFNTGEKESSGEGRPDNASNTAGMKEYTGFKNKRDVWTVTTKPFKGAHFATFPPDLIKPCILAGSRPGGIVLDPFIGSGTTAQVAIEEGRDYIGIDINPDYRELIERRTGYENKTVI